MCVSVFHWYTHSFACQCSLHGLFFISFLLLEFLHRRLLLLDNCADFADQQNEVCRHRGTANRKAAKIKTETTSSIQDTHLQICAQRVGTERVIEIVRVIIKNVRKWQQLKFFPLAQTL